MARVLTQWAVLSVGVIFHVAFLMSIFDIYFVSPLVHGMKHHNPFDGASNTPPADRLFLVVGDGLRADKAFANILHPENNTNMHLAPFLRSKILEEATFGVSHTRVPTESRPGHVAMIAGFYEDVSAVTKGWQENPVDFDSILNQSHHAWSFGSPDILPMFAQGAQENKVEMVMYGHEFEDFTKASIHLDRFVFDNVQDLFKRAESNATVNTMLREKKVVFFLHLLGIDTAGHGYRPYSSEYYDNIIYVDKMVQQLEKLVNDFYKDDKTAWVFTADHGMSDFGFHGDGHPTNTRTPLVVWGAGVKKPVKGLEGHDEESLEWNLPVQRNDVNQADIASLMAYLIGINYPSNSVGEIPLAYVDAPDSTKANALKANAYSIAEQYLVKEKTIMQYQLNYRPYPQMAGALSFESRSQKIESLISRGQYREAIESAESLMQHSLKGLRYLQTYNWLLLRTLVTVGFLGWIAYAFTSFVYLFVAEKHERKASGPAWLAPVAIGVLAVLMTLIYRQHYPLNHYLYAIFPVFFWYVVFNNLAVVKYGISQLVFGPEKPTLRTGLIEAGRALGGLAVLECMVYGYFHREMFSVLLVLLMAPWPWVSHRRQALQHWDVSSLWSLSCIALSAFTLQPVLKVENLDMITYSGLLMSVLAFVYTVYLSRVLKLNGITMVVCGIQIGLILLAVLVTRSSVRSLQARQGLPIGSQLVGWMTLCFSLLAPFLHSLTSIPDYRFRYLCVFVVFCPAMIILTISYEGYFYLAFALLLFSWFQVEKRFHVPSKNLCLTDFRKAIMFLFLMHIAFFGTGNIASISSFSLDSVYRLIPIFNPLTMGALLLFKLLVPIVLLGVSLGILNIVVRLPSFAIFSMVLCISDILALNFFYLTIDEGSWLDIGTGISHYCINSLLGLFVIFLEYLCSILVSGVQLKGNATNSTGASTAPVQGQVNPVMTNGEKSAKSAPSENHL